MAEFIRLAEVVNKKKDMRVVSINVTPTITDCSGTLWITDLQIQEGSVLAGYAPHTEKMLEKFRDGDAIKPPVWFNGIVRSNETVILCNMGETSTGLDIDIYPKSNMAAGTIELAQGVGGRRCHFPWLLIRMMTLLYMHLQENVKRMVYLQKRKDFISTVQLGIQST
ncbi:hypothetical protein [Cellulosilyticum ruminicola]|uniref:hypothetical protein n=1 Tax=Cellulosilyticum ruminicola TaxID=425254 RepID=UPI002E8E2561|nr:hypothetical protein [Cellulosilyticum ruminicola]